MLIITPIVMTNLDCQIEWPQNQPGNIPVGMLVRLPDGISGGEKTLLQNKRHLHLWLRRNQHCLTSSWTRASLCLAVTRVPCWQQIPGLSRIDWRRWNSGVFENFSARLGLQRYSVSFLGCMPAGFPVPQHIDDNCWTTQTSSVSQSSPLFPFC